MVSFNDTLSTSTGLGIFGRTNAGEALYMNAPTGYSLALTINGANELVLSAASGGVFTRGITATTGIFDQGAADGEILTLRSSDVAHGMTGLTDTSTYSYLQKASAADGGVILAGFTEASIGIALQAHITTGSTTKSTAASAAVHIDGYLKSGAGRTGLNADQNIIAFTTAGTVRQILDADGDSHQDVGTAWTNFDTFDDVRTLNILAAHVTRQDDPLREGFNLWMQEDRSFLEVNKLVTFNEDGHHFVNMSRLTMLHTGAIRQIGGRVEKLEDELLFLRSALQTKGLIDAVTSN
jgi:hypothetical protein